MNKKIIGLIGLALVLGLIIFVSAEMDSPPNTDEGNVELFLQEGWNLVSLKIVDEYISKDGSYLYYFNPVTKNYFGGDYNFISNDNNLNQIQDILKSYNSGGTIHDNYYELTVAAWLYVEEDMYERISDTEVESLINQYKNDLKEIDNFEYKLFEGWNLISILPNMIYEKIDSFNKDCNMQEVYKFEEGGQRWEDYKYDIENNGIHPDLLYKGLAVKVEKDCEFNFGGTDSQPPSIPV